MSEPLTLQMVDGVATVTIDHPPINLFDLQLYPALVKMADRLGADPAVRVVVLRSAVPDFFIAHFDVTLIQMLPVGAPPTDVLNDFHRMCEAFRTMPKATIAVIEGRVGGGGSELALSCDMRFAALGRAVFNQPEVALGILPGGSGTVRLPRLIGRSRALETILGCDDIGAVTAERWGWVNRALPSDELWPFVQRLAHRISRFPPHAVAAAKAAVLRRARRGARPVAGGSGVQRHARRAGDPRSVGRVHGSRRPGPRRRAAPRRSGRPRPRLYVTAVGR